jgi:hypothetical protein
VLQTIAKKKEKLRGSQRKKNGATRADTGDTDSDDTTALQQQTSNPCLQQYRENYNFQIFTSGSTAGT